MHVMCNVLWENFIHEQFKYSADSLPFHCGGVGCCFTCEFNRRKFSQASMRAYLHSHDWRICIENSTSAQMYKFNNEQILSKKRSDLYMYLLFSTKSLMLCRTKQSIVIMQKYSYIRT